MKLTLKERLAFRFIFNERRVHQRWYGRFPVFGIDYGSLRRVISRIDNWLDWVYYPDAEHCTVAYLDEVFPYIIDWLRQHLVGTD